MVSLLARHGDKIHALSRRLCGNAEDASDMVQEVFLQAYRKWHTFKGDSDPGTWLYAIAARSCKVRQRRKGGVDRRFPAMSQVMPWTESRIAALAADHATPAERAIGREAEAALHAAIVSLPEHFRVALVLKEMLELPIEEVSRTLGVKPETVKTRVHRARLLLRKEMMTKARTRPAPEPIYEKRVCLDLLKAKLDAMDKGRGFPIGHEVLCERCRAVFRELDAVQDTCALFAAGAMPAKVRARIERAIAAADQGVVSR